MTAIQEEGQIYKNGLDFHKRGRAAAEKVGELSKEKPAEEELCRVADWPYNWGQEGKEVEGKVSVRK